MKGLYYFHLPLSRKRKEDIIEKSKVKIQNAKLQVKS